MGRSSIIMVMGFNVIFALMGFSLSRVSSDALKNYAVYYTTSQVHNIAASAANIACNQIFFTPNWRDGYSNVHLGGGTYSVQVRDLPNMRIQVTARATMQGPNANTGIYEDKTSTIVIVMQPSSFSKFGYYSAVEGSIWWITGDTVWGPFHTEDKLHINGNPVFMGKTTAKKGMTQKSGSHPEFHGGYQSGVSIGLPSDMNPMVAAAGSGGHYVSGKDVSLTLNADGTITYQEGTDPAQTVPLSTYAPNGVIAVDGGNIRLKGTLNGRVTIAALKKSGSGGTVMLDDDVVYHTSPDDPSCTDMLGIVSDDDVLVTENAANNSDINIDASIFCKNGGFGAENYNSRPPSGTINLRGGIQMYQRGPVGTFNSSTHEITHGFSKNYRYDNRLLTDLPPMYPTTGSYEVVSWYE